MRIFKYVLETVGSQIIDVPLGAKFLSVNSQHDKLCLWAIVDPDQEKRERWGVEICGTGLSADHVVDGTYQFIGTYVVNHGLLVWHVWIMFPFGEKR